MHFRKRKRTQNAPPIYHCFTFRLLACAPAATRLTLRTSRHAYTTPPPFMCLVSYVCQCDGRDRQLSLCLMAPPTGFTIIKPTGRTGELRAHTRVWTCSRPLDSVRDKTFSCSLVSIQRFHAVSLPSCWRYTTARSCTRRTLPLPHTTLISLHTRATTAFTPSAASLPPLPLHSVYHFHLRLLRCHLPARLPLRDIRRDIRSCLPAHASPLNTTYWA